MKGTRTAALTDKNRLRPGGTRLVPLVLCGVLLALVLAACARAKSEKPSVQVISTENSDSSTTPENEVQSVDSSEYYDIEDSLGLIGISENRTKKSGPLRIYNEDGTVWYEFSVLVEDSAAESVERNTDLRPFRYDTTYGHFYFNCVGRDDRYYRVMVNDGTGLQKFIRRNDPNFRLKTWEAYILDCFAIEPAFDANPIRDAPNGTPVEIRVRPKLTFHPEETKGEWLRVRWYENNDNKLPPKFGWVRWRQDNKIVLMIFETA